MPTPRRLAAALACALAAMPTLVPTLVPTLALAQQAQGLAVPGAPDDTLSFNGSFANLPAPPNSPFSSANFALQLTLPSAVAAYLTNGGTSVSAIGVTPLAASFTDGSTSFSTSMSGISADVIMGTLQGPSSGTSPAIAVGFFSNSSLEFAIELQTAALPYTVSPPTANLPLDGSIAATEIATLATSDITVTGGFGGPADSIYAISAGTISLQQSVPEPATMALLAAPLAGLAFLRRRRA